MSVPIRHHYVPQVHIKKFKTKEGYFLHLKKKKEFVNPKSSRDFFLTKHLNTTIGEDGNLDHTTLENKLGRKWDNQFNKYFNEIIEVIKRELDDKLEPIPVGQNCLKFFFEYGLIGYMRRYKKEPEYNDQDYGYLDLIPEITDSILSQPNLSIDQQNHMKEFMGQFHDAMFNATQQQKKLKYAPILSEAAFIVPEGCSYDLFLSGNTPFILPDCTAIIIASRQMMTSFGREHNKISCVGIPLAPNIFLQVNSSETMPDLPNGIYLVSDEEVNQINKQAFERAFDQVLTIDKEALSGIVGL